MLCIDPKTQATHAIPRIVFEDSVLSSIEPLEFRLVVLRRLAPYRWNITVYSQRIRDCMRRLRLSHIGIEFEVIVICT